ncbi:porin [Rhizobium sp.]
MMKRIMMAAFALVSLAPLAHAEDAVVPNEFEQRQTVGACDYLGAGFAPLPGTGTCARVGGKVSVETGFSNRSNRSGGQVQLDFETRSN